MQQTNLGEEHWKFLHIFANNVRIRIIKQLSQFEMASLSDIAERLRDQGLEKTLPGLLKHMRILEEAGIVYKDSAGIDPDWPREPDARITVYHLAGKERVEKILQQLEDNICNLIAAGEIFNRTFKLSRKIGIMTRKLSLEESKYIESLLRECESRNVYDLLTEDEKKKLGAIKISLPFYT